MCLTIRYHTSLPVMKPDIKRRYKNLHPGIQKLTPRNTKTYTQEYKNLHPGIQKLTPWNTKTYTQEYKNLHPGIQKLTPRNIDE